MIDESFCRREALFRLQSKLASADRQIAEGKLYEHNDVFLRLKERVQENSKIHYTWDAVNDLDSIFENYWN